MRRAGRHDGAIPAVASALWLGGCGAAAPPALPPVVSLPVAPRAAVLAESAPRVAPPAASPAAPPPWVQRIERTEKTRPVSQCQIQPMTYASTVVLEERLLGPGRLAIRVVQDDERATGAHPQSGLLGKGYAVEAASHELHVHDATGQAVPDEEVRRVRSMAAAFVGWPGAEVVASPPAPGAEIALLEPAVAAVADLPLHGGELPGQSVAKVRFHGGAHGDAGDELLFDVEVKTTGGDAGMCHSWAHVAEATGPLRLRAADGALLELHLEGTTSDSEGLCQDPSGKPGPPPPPRTCNRGQVTVEVRQPHVPASPGR